jgi:hypothetical protein
LLASAGPHVNLSPGLLPGRASVLQPSTCGAGTPASPGLCALTVTMQPIHCQRLPRSVRSEPLRCRLLRQVGATVQKMSVLHDQQPGIRGRGGRLHGEPPTNDQLVRLRQVMRPTLRIKDQFRTNSVVRRWLANIPGRAAVSPWRGVGCGDFDGKHAGLGIGSDHESGQKSPTRFVLMPRKKAAPLPLSVLLEVKRRCCMITGPSG